MRLWKLVGLAGVAGVATAGALVLRKRRAWQEPDPDELRQFLHERLAYRRSATDQRRPA